MQGTKRVFVRYLTGRRVHDFGDGDPGQGNPEGGHLETKLGFHNEPARGVIDYRTSSHVEYVDDEVPPSLEALNEFLLSRNKTS